MPSLQQRASLHVEKALDSKQDEMKVEQKEGQEWAQLVQQ